MTAPLFPDDTAPAFDEAAALIALTLVPGVGGGRIRSLVSRFGSAAAALAAPPRALAAIPGIGPQTAAAIAAFDDVATVADQRTRAERAGATLLTAWDDAFPPALQEIYDPPVLLWMRGRIVADDQRAVAIVGTRRATEYGTRVAHDFAAELARRGFTIVSGLAYGIDAAAHRGALEAGGRTLAVLGSGVDRIYPARHARLASAIIEQGAVLSEYPMGAAPDAPNFPRRNRIISGLALGTLVVEAFEQGGALITARIALEQNREVFAIPSPIHSAAGAGTAHLIQKGYAKLVRTVDDLVEEFEGLDPRTPPAPPEPPDLQPLEQRLYDALGETPLHIDVLCRETGLDPSTALVYLLSLEFKGLVRQMAGKQFYRA